MRLMSELAVTIRDADRSVCGKVRGSVVDKLVAALSADPETIAELQAAVMRFVPPDRSSPIANFHGGEDDEPYDAGVCIIDLAARCVAYESSYSSLGRNGTIDYIDHDRKIEVGLPFHLADDWHFDHSIDSWKARADDRRRRRQAVPWIDARAVLYDCLAPFVARQCLAAQGTIATDGTWAPPDGWTLEALPERAKPGAPPSAGDAAAEIHARWLMTPREDLQGRTSRDVLLAGQDHIEWDLQHRGHQWSMLRQCPPGIAVDSAAYRFGGFGTHENLMYYDLVRNLIREYWDRVVQSSEEPARAGLYQPDVSFESLVDQLRQSRAEWFEAPCEDSMSLVTPGKLIALERERIPYAVSGDHAMIDCECPLCQMMAEPDFGPTFCHFDGCNNDTEYPFTFHLTREDWEAEQREYEDLRRRCDERDKLREAGLLKDDDLFAGQSSTIWKSSYSAPESESESPGLRLVGIGGHLGELLTDLKAPPCSEDFVESLNRYFGNVRAVLQEPEGDALLAPAVDRFCEELDEVAVVREDLREKCLDLKRQARRFAARAMDEPIDDDMPF
jgi:hypothetical protein